MPRLAPRIALACLAGALALTAAAARSGRAVDPGLLDPRSGDVERGRAIVVGAYAFGYTPEPQRGACFPCHGIDGRGDAAAAFPRLTGQVFKYLYDSLKDYASGVRQSDIMGPIARVLTDRQMRDVSAYYAAQKDAPYAPPPTYPYLAGQYALYLEGQLKVWKEGRRKGDGSGIMVEIARRLTDPEIRAVSAYYAALRPPAVTPERVEAAPPMVPEPGATTRAPGR